jgi:ABC-type transport system involved in cytochrome bd biosynthesis fused ATPase/permease subunit
MARLILNSPSVWLLDEPTSALDRTNADAVFDEIRRARERHLVLVVTHRPELLELCDTFVLVADGSIVATGPAADMTEAHPFIARMLAR